MILDAVVAALAVGLTTFLAYSILQALWPAIAVVLTSFTVFLLIVVWL